MSLYCGRWGRAGTRAGTRAPRSRVSTPTRTAPASQPWWGSAPGPQSRPSSAACSSGTASRCSRRGACSGPSPPSPRALSSPPRGSRPASTSWRTSSRRRRCCPSPCGWEGTWSSHTPPWPPPSSDMRPSGCGSRTRTRASTGARTITTSAPPWSSSPFCSRSTATSARTTRPPGSPRRSGGSRGSTGTESWGWQPSCWARPRSSRASMRWRGSGAATTRRSTGSASCGGACSCSPRSPSTCAATGSPWWPTTRWRHPMGASPTPARSSSREILHSGSQRSEEGG
mmetsp:Transcript_31237/g.99617  ORF Transcript_31237/g.99617 Transcript_31237/m.99617 type:complete len:285 (+) Transcript_31237:2047-2901(+)